MDAPNVGEMIIGALLAVPGQLLGEMIRNPGPWLLLAAVSTVVLLVGFASRRVRRRPSPRA